MEGRASCPGPGAGRPSPPAVSARCVCARCICARCVCARCVCPWPTGLLTGAAPSAVCPWLSLEGRPHGAGAGCVDAVAAAETPREQRHRRLQGPASVTPGRQHRRVSRTEAVQLRPRLYSEQMTFRPSFPGGSILKKQRRHTIRWMERRLHFSPGSYKQRDCEKTIVKRYSALLLRPGLSPVRANYLTTLSESLLRVLEETLFALTACVCFRNPV